jgi:hypothetical protein
VSDVAALAGAASAPQPALSETLVDAREAHVAQGKEGVTPRRFVPVSAGCSVGLRNVEINVRVARADLRGRRDAVSIPRRSNT